MKYSGSFGSWLKQRRKALDLTQMDLAEQVNCSVMTIRKIEGNMRRPSKQIAERLADVLAVSLDERSAFTAFARRIEGSPPQSTLSSADPAPSHNLPLQQTPFIGRAEELAQISERLDKPDCRLLALIGPGGIGKSRLALEAAREAIGSFADGVYFVSLASTSSPSLIASSIISALKVSFLGAEDPNVQVVNYLSQKNMLLVLDNFEHLLEGTDLLTTILANCAHMKLLITSRERLNIQEEWVLLIEGLQFPEDQTSDGIEDYPAVQLFAQRAQQVDAAFSLTDNMDSVIAICQNVEGMPLGIELAATWLRAMSCRQIAEQMAAALDFLVTPLRNVLERHRNMRAVFDQSWRLLSGEECHILMRLSVFRGGFDLIAAEKVADANLPMLARLVDKSLVRLGAAGRYDMHELLRQYACDRLVESGGVAAAERCHFDYFLSMAEQADPSTLDSGEMAWLDRLEVDHDNLQAALEWAWRGEEFQLGLHLAAALAWFWRIRFYRREGFAWLEKFLASSRTPSLLRVKALYEAALLISYSGDNVQAKALGEEALALARRLGYKPNIARCLANLGQIIKLSAGGWGAIEPLEEALHLFRELGDQRGLNSALLFLGRAVLDLHDYQRAKALLEEGLALARAMGIKRDTALHLCLLGSVASYQNNDSNHVVALYHECLALSHEVRDRFGVTEALLGLASESRAQGEYTQARRLYEESLATMDRETGHKYSVVESLWGLGAIARVEGNFEEAEKYYVESLILNQGGDKWDTAYCLAGLGGLAGIREQWTLATRLLGAAAAIFETHRDLYPADRVAFERDIASTRVALDPNTFSALWEAGRAMTLDEAFACALEQT